MKDNGRQAKPWGDWVAKCCKARLVGALPAWVAVALLSACALKAPERPAAPVLPAQWQATQHETQQQGTVGADAALETAMTTQWWKAFGSVELEALLQQVLARNQNLEAAAARVEQAQAAARIAGAELWPTLSASLNASRQGRLGGDAQTAGRMLGAGLAASYEVDLWGGLRAGGRAALERALASRFDQQAARLSISAQAVSAWLQWVALHERLGIAQANLDTALRLLEIITVREQAGAETRLALAQQGTLVAGQRREIAALRQAYAQAGAQLLVWAGEAQWRIPRPESLLSLRVPRIDAGVPSALLVRRPDIAAAEARLSAVDADVVVARAAMLPRLTLSASAGGSDGRVSQVLDNPVYALAAGLTAPIFNAGRLSAAHEQALARRRELLADYRQAILAAFADAQAALEGVRGSAAQAAAQAEELRLAQETLTLAEARYRAGAEHQLVLLDAQRALYAAQDAAVRRQADRLLAAMDLYRALGGGWTDEDPS